MEKLLTEVCDIQYGYPFDSSKFCESEGVPLIRIRDVTRGYSETFTTEEYSPEYLVYNGDLLIGMDGEFNIAKWGKTPALLNQRVCRLTPKSLVDKGYLYYYMPIILKQIEAKTPFVTVKHLSAKELNKAKIPLPPLDEQQKIAAVLDKVSDLIAKRRQQLSKLDEMVKSRFVEMFGDRLANNKKWNNKSLEKCAVFYNGKAHEQVVDENGQYILVTSKFVASDQKEYRRTNELLFPLYRGDICMVMSDVPNGRALAKCVLIDQDNKYTLNQRICCFRDYDMNSIFLLYVLNRHEYFLSFDDGDSQTNLRKNDILACPIILPPIELQNQFAAFVEQTEKTKATISRSLEKLETLKKALMQKYFG